MTKEWLLEPDFDKLADDGLEGFIPSEFSAPEDPFPVSQHPSELEFEVAQEKKRSIEREMRWASSRMSAKMKAGRVGEGLRLKADVARKMRGL